MADADAFIDGDLVESFLDLRREQMEAVVRFMQGDGWATGGSASKTAAAAAISPEGESLHT